MAVLEHTSGGLSLSHDDPRLPERRRTGVALSWSTAQLLVVLLMFIVKYVLVGN